MEGVVEDTILQKSEPFILTLNISRNNFCEWKTNSSEEITDIYSHSFFGKTLEIEGWFYKQNYSTQF